MKIIFVGAVKFSASALEELIAMKANVIGVCTTSESSANSDHVNLSSIAQKAGIPVKLTLRINDPDTLSWIQKLNPDIILCFGWSQLIRKPLLGIPPMGIIGYHPTALPANRGRHPLIWALALGLKETASSFFFMDEGADSGDILSQEPVAISPTDDAGSLYQRITTTAMSQIRDFIPQLSEGNYTRVQQDHSQANTWRKRSIEDGKIDWRMSADSIHNLVRALTHPYVGAHFIHRERLVKVWRTEIENNISANFEPGKVLSLSDQGILVKAGTEAIWLCEIDPVTAVETGDYL